MAILVQKPKIVKLNASVLDRGRESLDYFRLIPIYE